MRLSPSLVWLPLSLVLAGCPSLLPRGDFKPIAGEEQRVNAWLARERVESEARRSLPAVASLRLEGPDGGGRVKEVILVELPGRLRFETLNLETPTVDARAFSIGNRGCRARRIEGKRLSTYLQCGSSISRPNADQYEVTLQRMVQLLDAPGGSTTVRTTLDAYARSRSSSVNAIHCTSKGRFERRVVELIREELAGA